jgi:hypothetical protein
MAALDVENLPKKLTLKEKVALVAGKTLLLEVGPSFSLAKYRKGFLEHHRYSKTRNTIHSSLR